jgi:DNA polymerase I
METILGIEDGDIKVAVPFLAPFRQIWCVDFEYQTNAGERPHVVCLVAREFNTGREVRLWRNELLGLKRAPFDTGADCLFVAYYASAELGCFLELGWPLPEKILDLFVEHRVATNGIDTLCGDGLIGALAIRGLAHIDAGEKEGMRKLICEQDAWSADEQVSILQYCASDVTGLVALLPRMAPTIDWPRARLRGRYMAAVARMERSGVPIDTAVQRSLVKNWEAIKQRLVTEVDADYGVYEANTFVRERFRKMLLARHIPWPTSKSGALIINDDVFREQALRYPELQTLRELRVTLSGLRLTGMEVGADGRNRCLLSPFRSETGRNQPSNNKFVFGPASWLRGLIKPPEGYGLAYVDFSAQEIGIAAGLSGDEQMIEGYESGDPYLAFAKAARLAPLDATKSSHKAIRDRCKAIVLGINYGMGAESMATAAGITPAEARELLRLHRDTYGHFWRWSEDTVSKAMITNEIRTVFGWRRRINSDPNPRSLMNLPMQANGAEMMRIAAIAGTEAGIEVCAPVHDAFLIAAPLEQLDSRLALMREMMSEAGRHVTGGLSIRTDAEVVRYPDRYMDERGKVMWERVLAILTRVEEAAHEKEALG